MNAKAVVLRTCPCRAKRKLSINPEQKRIEVLMSQITTSLGLRMRSGV